MGMIYVAGYLGNANRRATSFTPTPAAHSKYPAEKLADGLPSKVFKFGSVAANVEVIVDINFLWNQGFEDWLTSSIIENWIEGAGAGSYARESSIVYEGTYSLKLIGAKKMYQDIEVLQGKSYDVHVVLRGNGVDTAYLKIQDLNTYKWYNASSQWVVSETYATFQLTATWGVRTSSLTVENCGEYKTTLRIYCESTAGSGVYFDDMYVIPKVNLSSIHGHNIPYGAVTLLKAGTSPGSMSTIATFTKWQPSFYVTFDDELYRFWKILIQTQAVGNPIWIGEWVLGHSTTLGQRPQFALPITMVQPRTSIIMQPSKQLYSRTESYRPSKEILLSFYAEQESHLEEIIENVIQASEWADEPLIAVPDTGHKRIVHARIANDSFPYVIEPGSLWRYDLTIMEDAFPVAGF